MDFIADQATKKGTLIFRGGLTIDRVADARRQTVQAISEVQDLFIDVEQATQVDLSFIQLFCSAHRSATAQSRSLVLTGAANQALQKALQSNGCSRMAGCLLDKNNTCLWMVRDDE